MGKLVGLLLTLASLGGLLYVMTQRRTPTMPVLSAEGMPLDAGSAPSVPMTGAPAKIQADLDKLAAERQAREDDLMNKLKKETQ